MRVFLLSLTLLLPYFIKADPSDTYYVQKTAEAPIIDGDLLEWSTVESVDFTVHTDGSEGATSGTAKVLWDDDAIYFAFQINDSDVKSNYTDQDQSLFNNDDLVEIFLDFDGDQKHYLELGISAANVNYDMTVCPAVSCGTWGGSTFWDITGLETASQVIGTMNNSEDIDEGYLIEVKIPFAGLVSAPEANFSEPSVGTIWKGNLYTIDYSTGAAIDAANDYLSWSTLSSFGFHQPSEFASFEFANGGESVDDVLSNDPFVFLGNNRWQNISEKKSFVKLYDLTGKQVKDITVEAKGSINLSDLNKGVYLILIEGNQPITQKLVVK